MSVTLPAKADSCSIIGNSCVISSHSSDWQIPFGRRFRSLKIWFVMRTYGLSGMQNHIRSTAGLGKLFSELIASRSDLFELFVEPAFALTVFTVKGEEGITKRVYE